VTNSWDLKLTRAAKHLGEFKEAVAPLVERGPYPVSKRVETNGQARECVRRLAMPQPSDPMLAVIAGDFMFNVRSALDHLAVAVIPPASRTRQVMRTAQFPIFTCDIEESDPITGKYLHGRDRGRWDRMTQGMTSGALQAVKAKQPYLFGRRNVDPNHSSMAILSLLQNADKHRQLALMARGLFDPAIRVTHPDGTVTEAPPDKLPDGRLLRDGTVVDRSPMGDPLAHLKMEVVGTPQIVIGDRVEGPYRACPRVFDLMLKDAQDCVVALAPFVKK
jgi:hypothetical protein